MSDTELTPWYTPEEEDGWICRNEPEDDPCRPIWQNCDDCKGTGKADGDECPMCTGRGGGYCCHHDLQAGDLLTDNTGGNRQDAAGGLSG